MSFIRAHWKALMPLVAGLVALAADHVADLDLDANTKTAIVSVLGAILVWAKANVAPEAPQ